MSPVTTHGWTYVVATDHPKEYPVASQQLANKLEATPRVLSGFVSLSGAGAVGAGSEFTLEITFTAGTFTATPVLVANFQRYGQPSNGYYATAAPGQKPHCVVSVKSASQAFITVYYPEAFSHVANDGAHWVAVGT